MTCTHLTLNDVIAGVLIALLIFCLVAGLVVLGIHKLEDRDA